MIADFRYSPEPNDTDVIVKLFWELDDRMGQIIVPDRLQDAIKIAGMPDLSPLPVISALAYGMLIAAKSKRSLSLSGDQSAWPEEWGSLVTRVTDS